MLQKLSPENYIKTRVRKLPIASCYINGDWKECGLANVFVLRKHSNGNVTVGVFLVDLYARGTKDTVYKFNIPMKEFQDLADTSHEGQVIPVTYALAHNIIYGANEFAEENGFKISKTFNLTQNILEEDTEDIEFIDIEFGKDGKVFLI